MLPIEVVGGRLYLQTDLEAPRGRVVWTELTAAGPGELPALREVHQPGGGDPGRGRGRRGWCMAVATLADVTPVVRVITWDGTVRHRLDLPGGSLVGLPVVPMIMSCSSGCRR